MMGRDPELGHERKNSINILYKNWTITGSKVWETLPYSQAYIYVISHYRSESQLITLALSEKISALMTEDFLNERAKRGDRKLFEAALSKVADIEPDEQDQI